MTRRRKVWLSSAAVLVVLGVLALPGVHWRLIGWAKGEPFWRGRPASYWRGRIASALVVGTSLGVADEVTFYTGGTLAEAWQSVTLAAGRVVAVPWETAVDPREVGADAVPVLRSLLSDPDPKVRAFAVEGLGYAGPAARPMLPALRELRHDTATVLPWLTVGDLVDKAIRRIDPDAPE